MGRILQSSQIKVMQPYSIYSSLSLSLSLSLFYPLIFNQITRCHFTQDFVFIVTALKNLNILHILQTASRTGFERSAGRTEISSAASDLGRLCVGLTSSSSKPSTALKPWQLSVHGQKKGRNAIEGGERQEEK